MQNTYLSWGRYPRTTPTNIHETNWRHESIPFDNWDTPVLPFAYGRSYGDSCQNDGGVLLTTRKLDRFIAFDAELGILRCEGGVSLASILEQCVPRGWFPPVTPGTQYVSIGGAIANDVHGKNHHRSGTFGCHVLAFEILRSTGERFICSPQQYPDLFRATIGGLGLTGIILWADIQLKSITTPLMSTERIRFSTLDEFFSLTAESHDAFEYTVAWIDCMASRGKNARGLFIRGNHCHDDLAPTLSKTKNTTLSVPHHLPSWILRSWSIKMFNALYYHAHPSDLIQKTEPYEGFFYPLDSIQHWNRLYGDRGFLQYQCVIPEASEQDGIAQLLDIIHQAQQGSFLAVLKKFGRIPSHGLLSFPRAGTTLALDFPFLGDQTLSLLNRLDEVVLKTHGAVYPAKDGRMSAQAFQAFYPEWENFLRFKDQQFSSSFWRRVTAPIEPPSTPLPHPKDIDAKTEEDSFATCGAKSTWSYQ